ncbi:MAG: hypothetical protein ACI90A_001719 [Shewanella sp.]|jgi:hypothetical protein
MGNVFKAYGTLKTMEVRYRRESNAGAVTEDARAENNESNYFMKTAMDGGNVVNARAINYLELCHFTTC